MSDIKEITKEFCCECCAYATNKKSNLSRHLVSKKHLKKMNGEETSSIKEEKSKTRKPRTSKKNVTESSVQTDIVDTIESDVKTQIEELRKMYEMQINELKEENESLKDNIELLQQEKEELQQQIEIANEEISKNEYQSESLKNDNENLKYQKLALEDKIIYNLKCRMQDEMEIIEEKKMIEKFNINCKFEQLNQEKSNDEIITNLKNKLEKIQEFTYNNIKNVKSNNPVIKMVIEEFKPEELASNCVKNKEDNYLTRENFELLNKENLSLTDELIKLEEELNLMKHELSNLNIEKCTLENDNDKKNNKKKNCKKIKNDNLKNPMEIYKELCRDTKFNDKIMNNSFIDKSNKCEIVKMNLIKSINSEDCQTKPAKLYQRIFTSVIDEMNSKNINFIRCIDTRRNKFEIHDGTEWKKYNEHEFEDIIKILTNDISNSLLNAMSNTISNIDNVEFMKIYKKSKECFLSEEGTKSEIIVSMLNPLYDDNLNFNKSMINLCKKICECNEKNISKKSSKKSSKKIQYDSDTDDDDSHSDSDDDSDDD